MTGKSGHQSFANPNEVLNNTDGCLFCWHSSLGFVYTTYIGIYVTKTKKYKVIVFAESSVCRRHGRRLNLRVVCEFFLGPDNLLVPVYCSGENWKKSASVNDCFSSYCDVCERQF